jgi:nitrilase
MTSKTIRAAVVQAAPISFNCDLTLIKVSQLCKEASSNGSQLVVFPEAFISCYPRGSNFGAVIGNRTYEGRDLYKLYWESSITIPGSAVDQLSEICKENKIHLVIGVIEKDGGTLYCTIIFFSDDGQYLGKHRKLMPTASERLIWGFGDGSSISVFDTSIGKIGGAICWENYMPMLRMAMYSKGIKKQIFNYMCDYRYLIC